MTETQARPGIFFAPKSAFVSVTQRDLDEVRESALTNALGRARLCIHTSSDDPIHEMLIAVKAGSYVRPHRHPAKTESFHIVEGALDVALFDASGKLTDVIRMGDAASGNAFYYRLAEPVFHTVILRSAQAIIHETTNGPFDAADTEYAPWAPGEDDTPAAEAFLTQLESAITAVLGTPAQH